MKNSEEPIYPIVEDANYSGNIIAETKHLGLTKREYFAGLAMQGLLSGRTEWENPEIDIKIAIKLADELLTQLEQKEK